MKTVVCGEEQNDGSAVTSVKRLHCNYPNGSRNGIFKTQPVASEPRQSVWISLCRRYLEHDFLAGDKKKFKLHCGVARSHLTHYRLNKSPPHFIQSPPRSRYHPLITPLKSPLIHLL